MPPSLRLALPFLVWAAGPARAAPEPPPLLAIAVTCAQATQRVREGGAVVFLTGLFRQERAVRDRSFCARTEIAELFLMTTRDESECPVGYRCREPAIDDWD
ncbi:hypothetical protein OPKNFCMD_1755 [Methylobacterium crusticola]|uniref:Uncharacterized protein n=1 Tax=Methylobacterium crusticola TaxID=1697972 RepID=A0ABQ4QUM3_9HYPH|nr:hypothetical protein [Methylobacterium crusticola]GJD49028.1 hypothetical protein OPKNFCMD_1755 [Methylobacterium crusticola]